MSPVAAPWAAWVLTYLLHSTCLIVLALLVARLLPARRAAWRDTLWKTALFGGLVTSTLSTLGAGRRFDLPLAAAPAVTSDARPLGDPARASAEPARGEGNAFVVAPRVAGARRGSEPSPDTARRVLLIPSHPARKAPANGDAAPPLRLLLTRQAARGSARPPSPSPASQSERLFEEALAGRLRVGAPLTGLVAAEGTAAASPSPSAGRAGPSSSPWRASFDASQLAPWAGWSILTLVSLGMLAGAARWLRAYDSLRRALAGRRQLTAGAVWTQLERLRTAAGLRSVRLSVSDALVTPITVGWRRPEICLPGRALEELTAEDLDNVLAHELAHVERADPLVLGLAQLLERVLFFQPLHRVAAARLRAAAEVLCDDRAVGWTGQRLSFARSLTRVASWLVNAPAAGAAQAASPAGMAAEPSLLGQRVELLLDDSAGVAPARGRRLAASAAIAGCLVLVPGVRAGVRDVAPRPVGRVAADAEAVEVDVPEHELEIDIATVGQAPPTPAPPVAAAPPAQVHVRVQPDPSALELGLLELRFELDQLHQEVEGRADMSDLHARVLELEERTARLDVQYARAIALLETLGAIDR